MECPDCRASMRRARDGSWLCAACHPEPIVARSSRRRGVLFVMVVGALSLGLYWLYYLYVAFQEIDEAAGTEHRSDVFLLAVAATLVAVLVGWLYHGNVGFDAARPWWLWALWMVSPVLMAGYVHLESRNGGRAGRPVLPAAFPLAWPATALVDALAPFWVALPVALAVQAYLVLAINDWWETRSPEATVGALPQV